MGNINLGVHSILVSVLLGGSNAGKISVAALKIFCLQASIATYN